jgi:hypothetical protein
MKLINPHRLFHGTWTPEWLDSRAEVSDGAKRLYAQLCRFAGNKGEAFPSYQKLAERLQKSRRQIIRLIEELCHYELLSVTHVKDKVHGNRANIYRFMWHPWMQLAADEDYSLVKVDFDNRRPPSDINDTTPGDMRVTSPSVKNVTHKRVIGKERGRERTNHNALTDPLPPPQKILGLKKAIFGKVLNKPPDNHAIDPWKSAKDAVEGFKQRKLYPREWDNIISEIRKLSLCANGEEALALKWYSKAAKAASLGLPLPPQQREPVTAFQITTAVLPEEPKITKPTTNPVAEEKWLMAVDLLQNQISKEAYKRWFSDIVPTRIEKDRLILAVPNRVYQNWIETNYYKEIKAVSEQLNINIFYQTYEHC